ncbi:MAG: lipid asymmetry maintenance ABC transporter permease subunit MlaE [Proteobacteria bacterium]|jgi:phospholipid/cholesterol/gamma-HCH transport system permease protein|uniref:lipid asymmetry maintenance ABC transporter permease subunit MlaE n=1 Tax=Piscinibacter sp. TaxID=1903157 RepID=UPI001B602FE0|nr:lipid asymmetry maintenance ABC transporter permease subunit MlaE [Piscinibacter sp.]MBP5989622.1 lipid asymmetry maintenance ABC transporter permease subunit MlaE [Piscinibacter sp.]MBP6027952.1 lipid asymmetry maintenance ABC transporter permease subunit MlaE [Piscinibacter sp.]MBS0442645.1 lipid asymmetry maintenance ABC transporter permease subunit MlaE [Pseudomonadota bacterium]
MNFLALIGARALRVLQAFGHAAFFALELLRALPVAMRRFGLVVAQIHAVGNLSLVIILSSGLAVGFVLALQMYYALVTYGATESLGLIVNLALVRELGPVVTALLFAGRAGTSLTAEIGLMKAGEQLAAMEMMAIDPKERVMGPRFIAGIVSMPILAILFSAIGILGAYVVAVLLIGVDAGNFWSIMQAKVDVWRDVGNGIVKSAVFGVICTFVALYQGHETDATPEGVAYATTRTVVISSLAVLGMDFILTALMFSTP